MPTERIYYEDSHIKTFRAVVTACEARKEGFRIALDRTAFFPEGGGQFGDRGTLTGPDGAAVPVTDTQEEGDTVWHHTSAPIPVGSGVEGALDWPLRFARMQCHTGEHIASGLFHSRYGLDNVGFHLGDQEVTIDLSGPVDWEQVQDVERRANAAVAEDLPVEISWPAPEELPHLEYRSKLDLTEHVRLVTIPGYDVCACCAPHAARTGEVGLIHFLSMQNWKGGVRLRMLCGSRAVEDLMAKQTSVTAVSNLFSVKPEDIAAAARRTAGELEEAKAALARMGKRLAKAKAEALPTDAEKLVLFEELDNDALRALVNAAVERGNGLCAAFAPEGERFRYIIAARDRDLRPLVKEMNGALAGRGGGSAQMVQGSVTAGRSAIEDWWATMDKL